MKQDKITPMELLALFHKSNDEDIDLTPHHQKVLSVLLMFVNHDLSKGYRAWPNTKTLEKRTGMHEKTIERARKALLVGNWLESITPATGPGHSCVYFINAAKIVDVAAKSGSASSGKPVAENAFPEITKEPHKRNTSGFVQNKEPTPEETATHAAPIPENVETAGKPAIDADPINPLTGKPITARFRPTSEPLLLDSFPPIAGVYRHDMWTQSEKDLYNGIVSTKEAEEDAF